MAIDGLGGVNDPGKAGNEGIKETSKKAVEEKIEKFDEAVNCILLAKDPNEVNSLPNAVDVLPKGDGNVAEALMQTLKDFAKTVNDFMQKARTDGIIDKLAEFIKNENNKTENAKAEETPDNLTEVDHGSDNLKEVNKEIG